MDPAILLARLRRLSCARPGAESLQLPPGLSPDEALQAVGEAVQSLEESPVVKAHSPALAGTLHIHIDGAARGNPGPAGAGVVLIGPDGRAVERLHRFLGEATNNVAEYQALLLALDRARALGYADLSVCSDSELLVRQLQGRYRVKHPI